MDNFDDMLHEGQPHNISRRSFMLRASVLATSAALLTFSPVGQAIASWATGPGEMPEAVGRMLLQGNCLAFNGERRDPVTGLYHLGQGYRAYNPRMMRFHAADSLSPFGEGGINPYAYCLGDPINAIDPTGHLSWQAGLGIGLGILGIIISIATLGMGIHAGIALNVAGVSLVASSVMGVASGALGIASSALESSHPELSAALGWASLGLGVASGVSGIAGAVAAAPKIASSAASRAATTVLLGPQAAERSTRGVVTTVSGTVARTSTARTIATAVGMQLLSKPLVTTSLITGVTSGALWIAGSLVDDAETARRLNIAGGVFATIAAITGGASGYGEISFWQINFAPHHVQTLIASLLLAGHQFKGCKRR